MGTLRGNECPKTPIWLAPPLRLGKTKLYLTCIIFTGKYRVSINDVSVKNEGTIRGLWETCVVFLTLGREMQP